MKSENILQRNFTKISPKYREFALAKDKCRQCSIYNEYKQVGQSEGNAVDPTFFFCGEALGKDEVDQVRPFIGTTGQRFRAELRKHKHIFTKKNTIISNVLSCRPKDNKFPRLADGQTYWMPAVTPKKQPCKTTSANSIVQNCMSQWVIKEINLLRPKIIIALGATALEFMMGEKGITANRGKWVFLNHHRAWGFATFHPSYVLRCERMNDSHVVQQFEDDIKKLADSWHFVSNDKRMKLSDEEWKKQAALDNFTKKKKPSSKSNWPPVSGSLVLGTFGPDKIKQEDADLVFGTSDIKTFEEDKVIFDEYTKKLDAKLDANDEYLKKINEKLDNDPFEEFPF